MAGLLLLAAWVALATHPGQAATFPMLTIPDLIPAAEGQPVVVPLIFDQGQADNVNTFVFSITYDPDLLTLDTTDGNNNNIPDAITVSVPIGFSVSVDDSVSGGVGTIFVTILNVSSPLSGMPSSTIMAIEFVAGLPAQPVITDVVFASSPAPFFADKNGKIVSGVFDAGSVAIGDVPLPTATQTKIPSLTPTGTQAASTATVSPTPTATPTRPNLTVSVLYAGGRLCVYAHRHTDRHGRTATATATATSQPPTATNVPPTATSAGATATSQPPTATPKPPTPTPGPFCGELVLNGGMENNSGWLININAFPASYVSGFAHTGQRSMRIGIVNYWENRYSYSSVQQGLTIPSTAHERDARLLARTDDHRPRREQDHAAGNRPDRADRRHAGAAGRRCADGLALRPGGHPTRPAVPAPEFRQLGLLRDEPQRVHRAAGHPLLWCIQQWHRRNHGDVFG